MELPNGYKAVNPNAVIIYHHGIKGQKWGVRRTAEQLGHAVVKGGRKAGRFLSISSKHAVQSVKNKNAQKKQNKENSSQDWRTLSDEELSRRISRLKLEKSYMDAYRDVHPDKVSKGRKFVEASGRVLGKSMKNIGEQATTYVIGKEINKVLKTRYGEDNAVNPKKGQKV